MALRRAEPAEAGILLDIVDLARQAGRNLLPKSNGLNILVPDPRGHDGRLLCTSDPQHGQDSLAQVMTLVGGLMRFA